MNLFQIIYSLRVQNIFYSVKKLKGNSVTVLCFHRVSDEQDFFWPPLRVSDFEKIIKYCSVNYQIISLSDLHSNKMQKSSKPLMAITFDDGYKDFVINALPILAKLNLASNHNVVVNCVEGKQSIWTQELNTIFNCCKQNNFDNPIKFENHIIEFNGKYTDWKKIYLAALKYFFSIEKKEREEKLKALKEQTKANYAGKDFMNWSDLKKCSEQGVEIGSHSMTHDVLDTISDDKDLIFEIHSSKEIIESKLGTKVSTLAFPNGKNNLRAIKIAGECGYENILLTEDRIYKFDKNSNNYPLLIPRMSVYDNGYYAEILRLENFQNTVKKIFRR